MGTNVLSLQKEVKVEVEDQVEVVKMSRQTRNLKLIDYFNCVKESYSKSHQRLVILFQWCHRVRHI